MQDADNNVIELAEFQVDPTEVDRFLATIGKVLHLITESSGCQGVRIYRVHEHAGSVVLLVEWDNLAAHLEGFRESDSYKQWRAAIGPFFVADPRVVHLTR